MPIANPALHHVNLKTTRLQPMIDWYGVVGAPFDGDALVEARAKGASPGEIHRRAYAGEFPPTKPFDPRVPL